MTAISIGSLYNIVLVYFRSHDKLHFPELTGIQCHDLPYSRSSRSDEGFSINSFSLLWDMELKLLLLRHSTILSLIKITDNTHHNISSEFLYSLSFYSYRYDMDLHRVALTQLCDSCVAMEGTEQVNY